MANTARFLEFDGLGLTEQQETSYNNFRLWRVVIMVSVWYSFYYLGRLNWGMCLPWMIKDLGISKMEAGVGATILFWAYSFGTLTSGKLGDIFGARIMNTIGGVGTTILNLIVAALTRFGAILIPWGINGFVQGQAYAPTNMMITQWYPKAKRGLATGIFATSMGVASMFVWLITGTVVANYGWRAAFTYPLLFCTLPLTIVFFILARSKPEHAGFPPYKETMADTISGKAEQLTDESIAGVRAWVMLFGNWRFLLVAIASFMLYMGRYGLLTWVPLFYAETAGINLKKIPIATIALPLGMMFGPIIGGWISDKFFKARRYQILTIYMIAFTAIMILLSSMGLKRLGLPLSFGLLALGGFFVLGSVGLVFTTACDFGGRKMAGTAVGSVNFFNYMGAGTQGVVIGTILQKTQSWPIVFAVLAGCAVLSIILINIVRE
jgi:OPA family glycerol-3-phosphate transporter-like MFS transporter